jgi:hypothetical protein
VFFFVMAGLVPAIHALSCAQSKDVDPRDKPGGDEAEYVARDPGSALRAVRDDRYAVI